VSKAQKVLIDRLAWLMPGVDSSGRVSNELLARLKELFEEDVQILVDYLHVVKPEELKRYVSDPTVFAALVPAPHKARGFLEVELSLAHSAIDMLLGGAGESVALRPLTEIEEGVITFVMIEALKALAPHMMPGLPRIRMDALAHKVDEAIAQLSEETHVAVVQLKAVVGPHSGYLRLLIPESVLSMTNPQVGTPERRARTAALAEKHLKRLAGVKTWLRAEIGRAQLSAQDLASLDQGDVMLVDEIWARPDQGEGTTKLRVGLGRMGHLDADLVVESERLHARITGISYGQDLQEMREPTEREEMAHEALADGRGAHHDAWGAEGRDVSDTNEGAELLNDIPLQIAVELGRLPVTAEQVVSLRVGQLLDLGRTPGEPVELSVNGKIVARGELVEVEGHLGVRILSLAG
jgi:flagellar motor switch protein FliM